MNKFKILKVLACCIAVLSLTFTGQLRSESPGSSSNISEPVGKQDPFETVKPIADVRKNVSQRIASLQETVEERPDLFVETMMLKFLKANNVERIVTKLLSAQGVVATDAASNSLVICDTRESLDRIIEEVRNADQTPGQVLVEVVIVDVQLNDEKEIGVNWYLDDDWYHSFTYQQLYTQPFEGGFMSIMDNDILTTIHAIQQVREVEILASPRVVVLSGEEAEIRTVEEIAYSDVSETSEGGSMTVTKFKQAGVKMKVKAIITDEGKVKMTVEPEQSVNTGTNTVSNSLVPVVDLRATTTTLLMDDGQVLVIGGLRKKEVRVADDKVPLFGDIPFIGFLFSNDKTEIKNSELLVLISPHILTEEDVPTADQMER